MPDVEFEANGETANGYLAEPEGEGPGLVMLGEWWGLDDNTKSIVDSFAKVHELARRKNVSLRTAAFMLAISRVGRSRYFGGI